MKLCVGLFGTCGDSTWRLPFMGQYDNLGINYFNPQVKNWTPECATEEAVNLANDAVILFPVTRETYGIGSLAETGFSILQAIRLDDRRNFIVMIHKDIDQVLKDKNPELAKESIRSRALVRVHLEKLNLRNVFLVEDFDTMLDMSISLYRATKEVMEWNKYSLGANQ